MGDFIKVLFGGATQESKSTPIDMAPAEYKSLRGPFAQSLLQLIQQGGGPQYSGPMNANIGQNEQTLLDQLMPQTGPTTARSGVIDSTLAGNYLPGQPGANPFLEAAIKSAQRPTLQGLEETLSRALPGRFTAAGHMIQPNTGQNGGSSAFDRAAAIATRGAADTIGDIATKISAGAYESERGRQENAVSLSRAEVDSTISNLQSQALPRLIQELGIERGLALFQQRTQQLLEILRTIGGVTAPAVANEGTSSGESWKGVFDSIPIFPKSSTTTMPKG